jgi:adenylate cyclase
MSEVKMGVQSESDELYLVQTENAHLKETIIALREELQKLDAQNEESVQKAVATANDEDRGVRTAIAMINALAAWNRERMAEGKKEVNMGIGLNTDIVVSGNIGSKKRMDYTMIGDGVNLAARLESACKQYCAEILISENTYKKLRGTYRIREIDRVVVKGKSEPVGVYEVLDYHNDETFPNLMEVVNHFKSGLTIYREGKWDKAIRAFEEALRLNQKDKLSQIYIDRCKYLQENPSGEDWNGVWVMTTK